MRLITRDDILMGRDDKFPLDADQERNLATLLNALHALESHYGELPRVTSGYRPEAINAQVPGAAKKSNHIKCLAVDFDDPVGAMGFWCLNNLETLEKCGLYLEHPDFTDGWCHLQAAAPKSKRRVFRP